MHQGLSSTSVCKCVEAAGELGFATALKGEGPGCEKSFANKEELPPPSEC